MQTTYSVVTGALSSYDAPTSQARPKYSSRTSKMDPWKLVEKARPTLSY